MEQQSPLSSEDLLGAIQNLVSKEEPKKEVDPQQVMIEKVREALESPRGHELAIKLARKDDFTVLIYQGLLSNIWGRVERGKIFSYNSRLTRLLLSHPATKAYLEG